MTSSWYNIKAAAAGGISEVFVYGEIGDFGISAERFNQDLATLSGKVRVRINSLGGSVFDAVAMHTYLKGLADVETIVDGIAASAASVVFAAGKVRKMAKAGYLMIHNPWTFAAGNADDLRKEAGLLDSITATLVGVYQSVSTDDEDTIRKEMEDETWHSSETAKAKGYATEIIDAPVAKASIPAGRFAKLPQALVDAMNAPTKQETKPVNKKLLALLGVTGTERETFLANSVQALGVTEDAIAQAEKDGKPDFLAEHIQNRITTADKRAVDAEAAANAQAATAKAILAALGINEAPADPQAAVAEIVKAKASAEAAEILAAQGIRKPLETAKASATPTETIEEIQAKFASMPSGPERSAFFAKHKSILF
jgi:ATP-dependent protease ClpP protease subunit